MVCSPGKRSVGNNPSTLRARTTDHCQGTEETIDSCRASNDFCIAISWRDSREPPQYDSCHRHKTPFFPRIYLCPLKWRGPVLCVPLHQRKKKGFLGGGHESY